MEDKDNFCVDSEDDSHKAYLIDGPSDPQTVDFAVLESIATKSVALRRRYYTRYSSSRHVVW